MKINYRETTNDLAKRIDIHQKYGAKDIDKWTLNLLKLKREMSMLDIGCGHGKQCFLYNDYLAGGCHIAGGDVSDELLYKAKEENTKKKTLINFIKLDFNQRFPFPDNSFDLVTCCFAIYYAKNIQFTIDEIYRVLRPGGRLFTSGPMPQNKKVFYEIIKAATLKPIPTMPGSSRYDSEVWQAIKERFNKTEKKVFKNPLIFNQVLPFINYVRASLSEDRKIWADLFIDENFETIIAKIRQTAETYKNKHGKIIMTKVVGGFIAHKSIK